MSLMIFRNYSNNDIIRKTLIKSLLMYEEGGGKVNKALILNLYKHISFLSSATILDAYNEEELLEKITYELSLL